MHYAARLLSETNTRVPEEEELMVINIDSSWKDQDAQEGGELG